MGIPIPTDISIHLNVQIDMPGCWNLQSQRNVL